jgi:ketosteroid isomerase-like protein
MTNRGPGRLPSHEGDTPYSRFARVLADSRQHFERGEILPRVMSDENVKIVRENLQAFVRGDLEAVFAACDPRIELEVSDAYFDAPRTYRGHDGMRELFAAQAEVFNPFRLNPETFLDAGDQVLVVVRAGGLARASGIEVLGRFGHLWTVQDSKIVHFKEFKDPNEALQAAGLSD